MVSWHIKDQYMPNRHCGDDIVHGAARPNKTSEYKESTIVIFEVPCTIEVLGR